MRNILKSLLFCFNWIYNHLSDNPQFSTLDRECVITKNKNPISKTDCHGNSTHLMTFREKKNAQEDPSFSAPTAWKCVKWERKSCHHVNMAFSHEFIYTWKENIAPSIRCFYCFGFIWPLDRICRQVCDKLLKLRATTVFLHSVIARSP